MKEALIKLLLVAGLAALISAAPGDEGTLRLTINAEPKTLDPLMVADEPSELVKFLTHGVLIRMNRTRQAAEPELATSWSTGENQRSISLQIRKGVTFSDGTPFDAADVCYTFDRLAKPETTSPMAEPFHFAQGRLTCRASGYTVTLQFPVVLSGVERLFDAVPILSSRSPQKDKAGLGPFIVEEIKAGSYILLKRNGRFWKRDAAGKQLPYLQAVRLDIQRNRDFELVRFRRGELDLVNNLDPESFERLQAELPGSARDLGVSLDTEQIWLNQVGSAPLPQHKKEWFRSTQFRLALSEAIRREDLASVVYRKHAAPAFGPVSPSNRYWVNAAARQPAGGVNAAMERLKRDGFRLQGKNLVNRSGNPVEFSIITNAGNKSRERMAAMVQQDLAAIGIRITVVPLDFPSLIERITKSFQYEACLLGLIYDDLDPNAQMNIWVSSAPQHQWNPSQKTPETPWEAEIDRLMTAQAAMSDVRKRKVAFDRVQQIAAEQAPFIYLVHRNALLAIAAGVQNSEPAVLRPQVLWNVERLRLDSAIRAKK